MKTLYLECNMGAAGDMLMAALIELIDNPDKFMERFNNLGIPGVELIKAKTKKAGITGTHVEVLIEGEAEGEDMHRHHKREHEHEHHHHHHTGMHEIEHIITSLDLPDGVKENAIAVYRLIAEAESNAHDCSIEQIHFHEVGTMDAIADVVGVCMLFEEISPEKILASPVHVGSGTVKCAHGILPVPAPATAYILRDVPIYGGEIKGELCTPTGAALLKHFVSEFVPMPVISVEKIGYGMGTKDFETANCLRVLLGNIGGVNTDRVAELCCNIDDMTGEEIGFATDLLMRSGALDVYTTPIGMKKNRPGILLTCMCKIENRDEMLRLIFKHTSTLGVREHISNRYVLNRREEVRETAYGKVRIKISNGWGVEKSKAEYEDLAKIAKENDVSVSAIKIQP